jgi:hypothetical protein
MQSNIWLIAGAWMTLAGVASLISIRVGVSVALIEFLIGITAGLSGIFHKPALVIVTGSLLLPRLRAFAYRVTHWQLNVAQIAGIALSRRRRSPSSTPRWGKPGSARPRSAS